MKQLRLKCITCEVLARPVYYCAASSPHIVDVVLFQRGLHNHPAKLRARLQAEVDAVEGAYDAVVLAYGLCGQSTTGVIARNIPLVIPRAHDCITLFLGSRKRYDEQFQSCPGTFWYAQDYIERDDGSKTSLAMGAGAETDLQEVYAEYVAKYGQENADYLMEVMGAWQSHYQRAAYIDMGVGDGAQVEAKAQAEAARRGWTYERVAGDLVLVRRLLWGDWETDFLVVPPGKQARMAPGEAILECEP
jgi:hypothetical protein